MKALTIKQPWASLIAVGMKDIENRTWKTNYRGRILIHSARTTYPGGWNSLTQAQLNEAIKTGLVGRHIEASLPHGAIIGSVEIVDCVQNHPSLWAEKGVWNWVLANPILFKQPIYNVRGKLSLWDCEMDDQFEQEREQSMEIAPEVCPVARDFCHGSIGKLGVVTPPALSEEAVFNNLLQLPEEEALRLAYIPVIITKLTLCYIDTVISHCVANRLPYNKIVRELREYIKIYNNDIIGDIHKTSSDELKKLIGEFFDVNGRDMTTLWWVINQELKKKYPELDNEYEFLTMVYMPITMLHYLLNVGKEIDAMLRRRLVGASGSINSGAIFGMLRCLEKMVSDYKLETSSMVEIAVKVISRKVDAIELKVED